MDFVFHHGGGQGGWVWRETIAAMELQAPGAHRYLALDVPGCGTKRGADTAETGFDEIVTELLGDIAAAGMREIVLVGHSQAGTVIPRMAALRPELFRRLIYVSCVAPEPGVDAQAAAANLHEAGDTVLGRAFGNPEVPLREQFRMMFCNDMSAEAGEAFLDKLFQDHWPPSAYTETAWRYDHLGAIPASYVICLADTILPPDAQALFAARLRAERTPRIDAGHQPMNTRPHGLAEILLAEAAA